MTDEAHEDIDLHTESEDLVRTLRSYGALTKARLIELSRAQHWREHTFDAALSDAIAAGRITKLSDDLFEIADSEIGR